MVDFIGYSLGISGNKASAISYDTAKLIRSKAFYWLFLRNFKKKCQPFSVTRPWNFKKAPAISCGAASPNKKDEGKPRLFVMPKRIRRHP
ncbi:hypothetical protein [uncultured Bilophila sp.]|uniref:hypothetical protein n=1 Tax=uncultured Bilophila sp. TaxID=529385 RepID=UPI00280BA271|nr:hypothetical protein [uncultured Bilophila sp.]